MSPVGAHRRLGLDRGGKARRNDCRKTDSECEDEGTQFTPHCSHAIDLGAICFSEGETTSMQEGVERCTGRNMFSDWAHLSGDGYHGEQPVVFGCIDYYTTQCQFDAINTPSYSEAMQAFATCAESASTEPGYCHGALATAGTLANSNICTDGVTADIGFHIRIPFTVAFGGRGSYTFRLHADYGRGSFIGVDGPSHIPDSLWGHVLTGVTLAKL